MLISVRIIPKPRVQRDCDVCREPIEGITLRAYGYAHRGDPPYAIYLHPRKECAGTQDKVREALELLDGSAA